MRRVSYIGLLIAVWLFAMAALALGLDGIMHPPFSGVIFVSAAYWSSLVTILLVEEFWPDCL
jgi:hypothetical protein